MIGQDARNGTRPFWAATPARMVRRGHFRISGERVERKGKTYQRGPMFAEWEAPPDVTRPYPVVLVHGGGFQGTEWLDTPDSRPGWAQRLVEAGYPTVIVDRPGHGRSPLHTDIVGPMGPPFSYEGGRQIYFPPDPSGTHTQWPFAADDTEAMDQFIAGYGPLPADLAASEDMDADRLARLLDRIGSAILLTHSASGPSGWLAPTAGQGWSAPSSASSQWARRSRTSPTLARYAGGWLRHRSPSTRRVPRPRRCAKPTRRRYACPIWSTCRSPS